MRNRQRNSAAIDKVSSSVVQQSVMRISSVGKRSLGRRSHHSLVASSISPAPTRMSTWRRYSPQLANRSGVPGARHLVEDGEPVGFEPRVFALPERRGGRQCQQMRQEIRGLVHQVDAQLVIGNADMDVHAADREPPSDALQIVLAGSGSARDPWSSARPSGQRDASRRRSGPSRAAPPPRRSVPRNRRRSARASPRLAQTRVPTSICDRRNSRAHLRAEQCLAFGQHPGRRIADDVARRPIDEEIFLLDAEGEFRLPFRQLGLPNAEDRAGDCERGSRRGQRPLST